MAKQRRIIAAGCGLALCFFAWLALSGSPVELRITPGSSAAEVAEQLREQGVLRITTPFRILGKLTGLHTKLKPGIYKLRRNMASPEVIWRLVQGGSEEFVKVTIPEGWRMEQIAERLEKAGVTKASEFLAHARAQQWEGFLFPTTYHFAKGMSGSAVAGLMRQEFDKEILPVYRASGRSLDLDKVVTLASIVEREAVLDSEKPVIASVYFNRFARNMKLEADPTVQYALGHWKKGLRYKDLTVESPYNTYRHTGMPPAPICNPGVASVRAVLYPQLTKYIYFMADYKGGHIFSETYAEFLKTKEASKKELKRQKAELKKKPREFK